MNFDLTEDQREIKRTAREFLASRYTPEKIRAIALDGEPDPHWDEIVELGWPDIAEYGIVELAVVAEELGYALAPSPLAAHWAAKLLHPGAWRAAGRSRCGTGRTAPRSPCRTPTSPTRSSVQRDVATAVVTRGGRPSRSASDATIEPARALDPTRPLFTVRFDGGEELTGDFGRAWHAIAVMAAAESVGVAARVTRMAVDYAKERKQFGRAIGSYQAVSHACAQMFLETEGARSVTYWAAWALDHDARAGVHGRQLREGLRLRRRGQRVPARALQVHGGIGFTWEHDLHLFLKRAEANAHAFGDARWHREQVAAAPPLTAQEAVDRALLGRVVDRQPCAAVGQRDACPTGAARSASPCRRSAPRRRGRAATGRTCPSGSPSAPPTPPTAGGRTSRTSVTLSLIEPMIFCCRRARVRSFSRGLHSFLRVRASASACLPSISCSPRLQPQRVAAVLEAAVDARDDAAAAVGDAAERVDQLREVLEVDLDEVVDLDAEVLLDGADRERRAAERVGRVDLVRAVAGDVDDGVARDRERRVARRRRSASAGSSPSASGSPILFAPGSLLSFVRASEPSTRIVFGDVSG